MKKLLIILLMILVSSKGWSEISYGDFKIGSDKSVIDEYRELKHSWGFDFKCLN